MYFLFNKIILFPGLLLSAGFLVIDGIWLELLPRLGISYGKVLPTLASFVVLRAGLLFLCLLWSTWLAHIGANALQKHTIWGLAALNLLLLGMGLDAFYIEPMQLTVGRIEVPLPGLSHPVRIVQLTDIHVERTTRREQALPGLVESLHPDMIVLTGDYLNQSFTYDPLAAADLRLLLGQLHAPLGIYAVNGNIETPLEMDDLLAGLGIRTLHNEVVRIPALGDHFALLGLNFTDWLPDQIELHLLMQQVKPGDFSLLLYHIPDQAYAARDLGVNLYLAGHTHGGQVRLPLFGAVFTNSRFGKTFEMGQYHLGAMTLYVSRGLGMTGRSAPRARFLCPPEVVVVDLVPAGAAGNP
jgi:predicted MPP superfamily phosphohydrolase